MKKKQISPEELEKLEVVIPELEAELEKGGGRFFFGRGFRWTQQEEGIMFRYYGKVPLDKLLIFLPGRSRGAIGAKATDMGLRYKGYP